MPHNNPVSITAYSLTKSAVLSCACIFITVKFSYAQQNVNIKGTVKDTSWQGLPAASVNIINEKEIITKYTLTDAKGAFSFPLSKEYIESSSPLWLVVSYVGFKSQRKRITAERSNYDFILIEYPQSLKEVVIKKQRPIETLGDTLRYHVDRFAQSEDRSIGDVLRRMPGIEVEEDGTIYYNGKKVSGLFIGGDDLMSGRYNLATKTIRKDMILAVDVLKNHQPIKVLKNKVSSNNTAINLVLKDEHSFKLSANGMVGLGYPKLYDTYITPMLFNQKVKVLGNLGLNNAGMDYRNNLKQLASPNFLADMENISPDLTLSLATVGPPDISVPNYYFNQSKILDINSLYNIKNNLQVKLNLQGFSDKNSLHYTSIVDSYLQNDTIHYNEMQSYTNDFTSLRAAANVMINKEKLFFNNSTKLEFADHDDISTMNFNGYAFNQSITARMNKFSNDINLMPLLKGKGIAELRWVLSHNPNKQKLDIGKGYYSHLPGQQGYYDNVLQFLNLPTLYSNAYLGYKISRKIFRQSYKAGYLKESQTLSSLIYVVKGDDTIHYAGDNGNNLNWRKQNVYTSSDYEVRTDKLVSTIQLPLTYQYIRYYQGAYNLNIQHNNILFNPLLNIKFDFTPEQSVNGSYGYDNVYNDITGVYRGGIMENYRTFVSNGADLQVRRRHSFKLGYNFQKAVQMLFFNTTLYFDKAVADAIISTEIMDDIQKTVYLPVKNRQSYFSLKGGVSKYLFSLKTTIAVKPQWSSSKYIRIINNQTLPFTTTFLSLNAKLQKKVFQRIPIVYEPSYISNKTTSRNKNNGSNSITSSICRFDHFLSVGISPFNQLILEASCKQSTMHQPGSNTVKYFFMDAKATYNNKAKRVDLSLAVTNIFNIKRYVLYSSMPDQIITNQYDIRGRMAIARLTYYL